MDSRSIMLEILSGEVRASDMTQTEIARRAGTTQVTLCLILSGRRNFGIDMYGRILAALGREPIFGTRPSPPAPNPPGEDPT